MPGNIQRRAFIELLIGGAAAATLTVALPTVVMSSECVCVWTSWEKSLGLPRMYGHKTFCPLYKGPRSLDEMDENYRALRERLRQIAERGYEIERFELGPEDGGFRFVRVFVTGDRPLTWYQPWDCHASPDDKMLRTFRQLRKARAGLQPDIAVSRFDRTLADLRLADVEIIPTHVETRWDVPGNYRPPVGFSYWHRCEWHVAAFAGPLLQRKLRCLICETEDLREWTRHPFLLGGKFYRMT